MEICTFFFFGLGAGNVFKDPSCGVWGRMQSCTHPLAMATTLEQAQMGVARLVPQAGSSCRCIRWLSARVLQLPLPPLPPAVAAPQSVAMLIFHAPLSPQTMRHAPKGRRIGTPTATCIPWGLGPSGKRILDIVAYVIKAFSDMEACTGAWTISSCISYGSLRLLAVRTLFLASVFILEAAGMLLFRFMGCC